MTSHLIIPINATLETLTDTEDRKLRLPRTCSLGQFLRFFCASDPAMDDPALLQPWVGPGTAGKTVVTAASDGTSACVWVAGRDRSYPEWASLSPLASASASPLSTFRPLYRSGARHPLAGGKVTRNAWGVGVLWEVDILGSLARIPSSLIWALSHCDSCFLGLSTAKPVNGLHPAVSIKAALGGKIIQGVILCPNPNPAAP